MNQRVSNCVCSFFRRRPPPGLADPAGVRGARPRPSEAAAAGGGGGRAAGVPAPRAGRPLVAPGQLGLGVRLVLVLVGGGGGGGAGGRVLRGIHGHGRR